MAAAMATRREKGPAADAADDADADHADAADVRNEGGRVDGIRVEADLLTTDERR